MSTRPSWDQYFLQIAGIVASRSTCPRAQVGSVIVRNRLILSSGFNGAPMGLPHCIDEGVGCDLQRVEVADGIMDTHCRRTVHAEMNAIIQAARNGANISGAHYYSTHSPCRICFMALINANIAQVTYEKPYRLNTIAELVELSGIQLVQIVQT
jgi:dCMP deaminase